ncbi:hypothetical protein Nepgr_000965 [Nepenthes gracilis]|uniref:Uncharacterized protein n=1 Tax=Nepenthes gracilis TaxID=150966 RepID=A0AAD3P3M5_NEPGR|nr:hypothetical protein Nepgr_000965 [Nepenthes gracilis]
MALVLRISLSVSLFPAHFTLSRPSFFQILLFPFPQSLFCCFFRSFTLSFPLPSSLPSLFSYQFLVAFSSSASAHRIAERVRDDSVVAATVNCRNRNQRDTPMLSLKRDWIRQGWGQ